MAIKNQKWFLILNRAYDSLVWQPFFVTPFFLFMTYRLITADPLFFSTRIAFAIVCLWFALAIINSITDGWVVRWTNKSWGIEDEDAEG
jgi:hypothetical protein